ncbi:MAG: CHAT domain-containing protein [Thermoanaerobaculia bacterium]|nr:CHAT domain-containing protein [Thermoanaerobaculia bacterium]
MVVSLWDVHDKATAELMTSFHRQLRRGDLTPDEALRRAQLELRQNPSYALPYYWAGFIFQGDWNPLPNKIPAGGN